jgi:hypothetical protein
MVTGTLKPLQHTIILFQILYIRLFAGENIFSASHPNKSNDPE